KRNTPEVEHREQVRVADLVLKTESNDVEITERGKRLETVERQGVVAEQLFEIGQRGERPFACPSGIVVEDAVKNLQAVMVHAERVRVGKRQTDSALDVVKILDDGIAFAAEVLRWSLDGREQPTNFILERFVFEHPPGLWFNQRDCFRAFQVKEM